MAKRVHIDRADYWKFTGPMRVSKAVHTLQGIVVGMNVDGNINAGEVEALRGWTEDHRELASRHPFNDLIPMLDRILADGKVDEDEVEDILYVCGKLEAGGHFYKDITAQMQQLQGVLAGIVADGEVSDAEVEGLSRWLQGADELKSRWPFDEIESLITQIRQDRQIDGGERQALLAFLGDFTTLLGNRAVTAPATTPPPSVRGICSVAPDIAFVDKTFAFTGASTRLSRDMLAMLVGQLGGTFHPRIKAEVSYLIIGADGNPCWAYSCYGRKVEQAVELRRAGHPIQIVHEHDFWDAVQDRGVTISAPA